MVPPSLVAATLTVLLTQAGNEIAVVLKELPAATTGTTPWARRLAKAVKKSPPT